MSRMLGLLLLVLGVSATWAKDCSIPIGLHNYAKHGHASQSSTYEGSAGIIPGAELAIDGNDDSEFKLGSCMHTKLDYGPWLTIDMRRLIIVGVVVLTNRQDCCRDRLMGAQVLAGTSPDVSQQKSCGVVTDVSQEKIPICCDGIEARFITIKIPERWEHLHVCEVEVFDFIEGK
ncbi:fucolectin-7-like [Eleutherodactylus coqui]|uniref:Fucolectin tachylectin-4 pentraxin-1 domain-containing protein n=1 Tax=Eleutherodactylus coqui TaxID=57060 RepID=A0A8J6C6B4_ELECQ|nr:hypothetical protein GDO78_019785 [Eleutherodactylus coqui]